MSARLHTESPKRERKPAAGTGRGNQQGKFFDIGSQRNTMGL
jgi:hypothetical protein